jgi:hypothetical protein
VYHPPVVIRPLHPDPPQQGCWSPPHGPASGGAESPASGGVDALVLPWQSEHPASRWMKDGAPLLALGFEPTALGPGASAAGEPGSLVVGHPASTTVVTINGRRN